MKKRKPPEYCPVCDADVPPTAKACPKCGACYESGWKDEDEEDSEEIDYDLVDLPDEVLDPEELKAKRKRLAKRGIPSFWWWIAIGLVVYWLVWFLQTHGALRLW